MRSSGKSMKILEFERAQSLGATRLQQERIALQQAVTVLASKSTEVVLGIVSTKGSLALSTLFQWQNGLALPKKNVAAYDESESVIDIALIETTPVYLKYNSTGKAYLKPFECDVAGVIFQPNLGDNEFYQYGNLPVSIFSNLR